MCYIIFILFSLFSMWSDFFSYDFYLVFFFFFFKQKTAYEMRISDWSSDVCSSDLAMAMGCIGDCLDVHDVARRVAYGFAEYRFGVFVDKRFQGGHIVVRGALDRNALARKGMRKQDVSAAIQIGDRKSTRLNSSHYCAYSMPSSA